MKAYWIFQYNQDKDEFVTMLKSSLDKPSQHYTFQALAKSFNGTRTFFGHVYYQAFNFKGSKGYNDSIRYDDIFGVYEAL